MLSTDHRSSCAQSAQELKDARRRGKPRISSRKASMEGGWVWAIDLV